MPTYEYRCPECGNEFEKFQRMSDEPVAECPACGAKSERKISAGAGLLFKGSGFYITDYRGEGYKKAAESDKGGSSSSEAKAESRPSEAKPEPKTSEPKSTGSGGGTSGSKSGGTSD
jgi:putative FmdB family regulatory protein